MTIIEAQVIDQTLKVTKEPVVASGGINETTVLFSFCENWTGFIKTAVFADAGKENWYNAVLDVNNKAVVPAQVTLTKGRFWFGVVGIKDETRYTTQIVQYDVVEGAVLAIEDVEPPQAMIDQILASVGAHTANMENPHQVTKEQLGLGNVDNTADKDKTVKHAGTADNAMKDNFGKVISEAYATRKEIKTCPSGVPVKDDKVAYIKNVPSNSLPAAKITKLGGMTRKCANLWKPYTTQTINGVTLTVDANGVCTLDGTCTGSANFATSGGMLDAGTYWFSDNAQGTFSNDSYARVQVYFESISVSLETHNNSSSTEAVSITLTKPTSYSKRIRIENGHTYSNCKLYPMLNAGTEPLPYEPYFEGLRSAPVTEVESVGANLTTAQAVYEGANAYAEVVVDGRNCIKFNSGAAKKNYPIKFEENTQYTVSFYKKSENYNGATTSNMSFTFWYSDGTQSSAYADPNDTSWKKTTFTSAEGKTVVAVGVGVMEYRAFVYLDIDTFMLNEGATALPYTPYQRNTLEIPEAVRPKNGINENVYDYIDFETKKSITNLKTLVLKGTEDFSVSSVANRYNLPLYDCLSSLHTRTDVPYICSHYTAVHYDDRADKTMCMYTGNGDYMQFVDSNFSTVEDFKAHLAELYASGNPVTVVYPLATPIVTDISDKLPTDNFIGVEGGGTLTFKNEFGYAVPSEVINYLNAASGVIVDGSPALKVGDTIITEAQLKALLGLI